MCIGCLIFTSGRFLASLTESQHTKLIEIYESSNADDHINDDVAIKLIDLFKLKKEELSLQSRTRKKNCLCKVEPERRIVFAK